MKILDNSNIIFIFFLNKMFIDLFIKIYNNQFYYYLEMTLFKELNMYYQNKLTSVLEQISVFLF